jgi:ABC-type nickel/cobalt efflux system permease component RcnA
MDGHNKVSQCPRLGHGGELQLLHVPPKQIMTQQIRVTAAWKKTRKRVKNTTSGKEENIAKAKQANKETHTHTSAHTHTSTHTHTHTHTHNMHTGCDGVDKVKLERTASLVLGLQRRSY